MSENPKIHGRGTPPGMPRWVKLLIVLFVVVVLLIAILHLMGVGFGGHHFGGESVPWLLTNLRPSQS